MAKPGAIQVRSDDRTGNLSAETWQAFALETVTVVERDDDGGWLGRFVRPQFTRTSSTLSHVAGSAPAGGPATNSELPPAGDTLTHAHVEAMLADGANWKLAVRTPGEKYEVLDRGALEAKWKTGDSPTPVVRTRQPQAGEPTVLKWQDSQLEGDAGEVDKLLAIPITAVGGLGAILGLLGIAKDSLHRPAFMIAAIVVVLIAIFLAWRPRADVEPKAIHPGRLDQAEARYASSLKMGLHQWQKPAAVFAFGVVLAVLSIALPAGSSASTEPAIDVPTSESVANGFKADITVAWEKLPEGAVGVRTRVLAPNADDQIGFKSTKKEAGGGAHQKFSVVSPSAGEIEVRAKAVDGDGKRVGAEKIESFPVPVD